MQRNQAEQRALFMQQARRISGGTGVAAYERLKRMYLAVVVNADPEQYQQDMRELSNLCGV